MLRLSTFSIVFLASAGSLLAGELPYEGMGGFSGEVGPHSAILQTRLTRSAERDSLGLMPVAEGWACFEMSAAENFSDSWFTRWLAAREGGDFIVKEPVAGLAPDTRYFYRVHLTDSPGDKNIRIGPRRTFRTAPAPQAYRNVSFTVTTSHHYVNRESDLGFESYEVLSRIRPNFNVLTGDNVYYDTDPPPARELAGMRFHWHRMYSMPRLVAFYSSVPAYFMKDDHDYRFDDADPYMPPREGGSPDDSLGRYVFLEQAPVPAKTFRSVRWGAALEIWFPEGRDFRSPNGMPDGPGKTLWGVQQQRWLKESIRNSNALFKMLCSPTALLGPDRADKVDGHANRGGFFTEGQNFLAWLKKSGINNFYITCGDRHWKYHSVHLATGYEEFCSGALTDGASVSNPDYSDLAVERKWYLGNGGFLLVRVEVEGKSPPEIVFDFYDRQGRVVHTVSRKFQK